MTNTFAIWFGIFLLAMIGLDWVFFDWSNLVFLAKKLADLIEWLAFWR